MTQRTLHITGVRLNGRELDEEIFDNDRGTWNVSRAREDCFAGKHGTPWLIDVAEAYAANAAVEVDEAKVQRFMTQPKVLEIPGICVMEEGRSWLIEGHHRLRARHRLRLPDMVVYVIEEPSAARYHVLFNGKRKLEKA